MAKLIAGPWRRLHEDYPALGERVDACYMERPEWSRDPIKVYMVGFDRWHSDSIEGCVAKAPRWIRRYHEAVPDADADCRTGRSHIDMEHAQDGSAILTLQSAALGNLGSITLSGADLESVASWLNKVVEANKR